MLEELKSDYHYEQLVVKDIYRTDARALICIGDTTLGPGLGGIRIRLYGSHDEAEVDVIRLAMAMTKKAAMIWPDYKLGGGKAVIIGDPKRCKTPELLEGCGEIIHKLEGRFIASEDMNFTVKDIEKIRLTTPYVVGRSIKNGGIGNPAPFTAQGCIVGQYAALQHIYNLPEHYDIRMVFEGKRLVFQGCGSVGFEHAILAKGLGASIVACDVNSERIRKMKDEVGAEIVNPDDIYSVSGDIFIPSAIGGTLNSETISFLQCPIVAGCANNQLAIPDEHGKMLMDCGILYAPDYVINAGGLIAVADEMLLGGPNKMRIKKNIGKIGIRLRNIFARFEQENESPHKIADKMSSDIIDHVKKANEVCSEASR